MFKYPLYKNKGGSYKGSAPELSKHVKEAQQSIVLETKMELIR